MARSVSLRREDAGRGASVAVRWSRPKCEGCVSSFYALGVVESFASTRRLNINRARGGWLGLSLETAFISLLSRLACASSERVDVGRLLALYRIIPLFVWKNSCGSFLSPSYDY